MKIRTLVCSTLLASTMGIGMAGTAQADSGYYGHERDNHYPLHYQHHDRGHHPWGLYRKTLQRRHGHHREYTAYHYDGCARQDRRHGRHDDHDGDYNHRSSY